MAENAKQRNAKGMPAPFYLMQQSHCRNLRSTKEHGAHHVSHRRLKKFLAAPVSLCHYRKTLAVILDLLEEMRPCEVG
jgi:hypothetical protein